MSDSEKQDVPNVETKEGEKRTELKMPDWTTEIPPPVYKKKKRGKNKSW
jgi:hypothetical protein